MKPLQMPPPGKRIYVQEVALRDGFQMEPVFVPTEVKVDLVERLAQAGLAKIEVTSFTSPKAIPALADAEAVMGRVRRVAGVKYTALVPNLRGCERAMSSGVDEINLVMSASASHSRANLRMSPEDSLKQFEAIAFAVGGHAGINASISTAFGCPFEGEVPAGRVMELVGRIADMGIPGVTLCDTTGMAHPVQVAELCAQVMARWPRLELTAHFHNTRGMGLANVLAALQAGVDRFDASLGGLGGCPYAPGASGNICTEDLAHMLQAMGYDTGVNLESLIQQARRLPEIVGHDVPSQVMRAGPSTRLHPLPGRAA